MNFRSAEMEYYELQFPIENSWLFVERLSALSIAHILNSNSHMSGT